jgi:hypothetical protein
LAGALPTSQHDIDYKNCLKGDCRTRRHALQTGHGALCDKFPFELGKKAAKSLTSYAKQDAGRFTARR